MSVNGHCVLTLSTESWMIPCVYLLAWCVCSNGAYVLITEPRPFYNNDNLKSVVVSQQSLLLQPLSHTPMILLQWLCAYRRFLHWTALKHRRAPTQSLRLRHRSSRGISLTMLTPPRVHVSWTTSLCKVCNVSGRSILCYMNVTLVPYSCQGMIMIPPLLFHCTILWRDNLCGELIDKIEW